MVNKIFRSIKTNKVWIFRCILILILAAIPFYGEIVYFFSKNPRHGLNITDLLSKKNQAPVEVNYFIDPKEDHSLLDKKIAEIFPEGSDSYTPEEKSIRVMQFVTVYLKHQNNAGTATEILHDGYSICGGKSYVFRILVRKLGLPARYVGLHYTPSQGGHDLAEVYYDSAWHLFDPTYGTFVYSGPEYDKKGKIVSMDQLRSNPNTGFMMQTTDDAWSGNYTAEDRNYIVKPIKKDLFPLFSDDFDQYWRTEVKSAFPVAYGSDSWVSVPIDADLLGKSNFTIGTQDGSHTDVSMHRNRYEGYGVLGKSRDTPGVYNTWSLKAEPGSKLSIRYWASKPLFSGIRLIPLRSVRLEAIERGANYIDLKIQILDEPAIFIAIVPEGSFVIDSVEVTKQ